MHPAFSIIVFTTASGAGYGLLFLLGGGGCFGLLPQEPWFGLVALGLALGLITCGLLSSTLHLGHPERAWRALSQWRSSWLSREGVAALASYAPALIYAVGWAGYGETTGVWGLFGLLSAAGALATLFCTAMIYASLKPVAAWRHPLVVPGFLLLALATGALWLLFLLSLAGSLSTGSLVLAVLAVLSAWAVKLAYWQGRARGVRKPSAASATGLGDLGRVRPLEPPHTGENYLLREMGYQVARRHADKLRRLAVIAGAALPLGACLLLSLAAGPTSVVLAGFAAAATTLGTLIERWLFFAEAKHSVTLYYRGDAA